MASLLLIITCVYFTLNSYAQSSVVILQDQYGNPDWKTVMKKIEELQNIVKNMDDYRKIVEKQNDRIAQLEARVRNLETILTLEKHGSVDSQTHERVNESNGNNAILTGSVTRQGRLLSLQPTTVPIETVAFFAYSTSTIPASIIHHILIFDNAVTNVGNAYHPHSGTFIAPRSGLYVFTWTIRLWGPRYHTTELLVDNNVVNSIYLNPVNTIDGGVTGTVVVHVNQGDDVFVRTGTRLNNGDINSDIDGRSSFAGWILM